MFINLMPQKLIVRILLFLKYKIMIRIIPFIAQILFAVMVFQDAQERKMNYWLWSAFTLIVPVIGIIAYFIMRKPKYKNWK